MQESTALLLMPNASDVVVLQCSHAKAMEFNRMKHFRKGYKIKGRQIEKSVLSLELVR